MELFFFFWCNVLCANVSLPLCRGSTRQATPICDVFNGSPQRLRVAMSKQVPPGIDPLLDDARQKFGIQLVDDKLGALAFDGFGELI